MTSPDDADFIVAHGTEAVNGAGDTDAFEPTAVALRSAGRMKFLRPLYRSLKRCPGTDGAAFAVKTFQQTRAMYHPIAEKMVAADLGL